MVAAQGVVKAVPFGPGEMPRLPKRVRGCGLDCCCALGRCDLTETVILQCLSRVEKERNEREAGGG